MLSYNVAQCLFPSFELNTTVKSSLTISTFSIESGSWSGAETGFIV